MILIMLVSLYTTRVVLNILGESDYGIYNIVGSVVVSMVFIQYTLISATQRFLSYELGLGDSGDVAKVFSSSLNLHLKFLAILFVIFESIGLWFLNSVLDIPSDRMFAANVVYQFTILTFCLNIIRTPYNAIIISYESMDIYAVLSIVEAILKLVVVIALKYFYNDKLIAYGVLIFAITLIINALYIAYCRKHYRVETAPNIRGDKTVIKKLRGFLGWNLLGGITGIATNEGPNFFMNYFLGVSVNAAMGVAKQVSGAIYSFASSFQSAFNPQIVKAYASNEKEYLLDLINKTSLLSFYLLFIVAFPIIICADFIFGLWLVDVPHYSIVFCLLLIASQVIAALASPLWMVAHATGDIKYYQITISILCLVIIPASYFILANHYPPYYILGFQLVLNIVIFGYRLLYVRRKIGLSLNKYIKDVIMKSVFITLCIVPIPLLLSVFASNFWQYALVIVMSFVISIVTIYFLGIDKETRLAVKSFMQNRMPCFKNRH